MKLFSFDKFWNLAWKRLKENKYTCEYLGFVLLVDKSKASTPKFHIYRTDKIEDENCVANDMDSDMLILQLKSIKETGKIARR